MREIAAVRRRFGYRRLTPSSVATASVARGQDLADKLSRNCRRIVTSDWCQQLFPTRLSPQRQAVPEFETTAQGCRVATSVGGVLTGRGADIIVIDDPLKARRGVVADPAASRQRVVRPHPLQPLNDKLSGAIVLIMHRLHESLPSGATRGRPRRPCAAQDPWEADDDELHRIETVFGRQSFRRKADEALHPEREPPEMLEQIRRTLGE